MTEQYNDALFNDGHAIDENTDIRYLAGLKLMSMPNNYEYMLISEAFGQTPDTSLEELLSKIRAALVDESTDHDADIGEWLRKMLVEHMRSIIIEDREHEAAFRGWYEDQ